MALSDIFGFLRGGSDDDTLVGAETALSRLYAEKAAAVSAMDALRAHRHELLLEDGSDKKIAAVDRDLAAHQLVLDRVDAVEGSVIDRLQGLRSDHRRGQWKKIYGRHAAAASDFITKYREAVRSLNALIAITDEARAAGFEHEAMAHFPFPPTTLDFALVANYESAVEDIADAVAGRRKPMPVQPVRKPYTPPPAPPPGQGQRRVSLADVEDRPPPKPRRALRADQAGPGQKLVSIARTGFEAPDGSQCRAGDVIALPAEQAEDVVRNGAGDFADPISNLNSAEG